MTGQRFSKFVRPEEPTRGEITDRDLDIFEAVLRYRFCSAAHLVRLVGGNEDVTHRRLRRLWEWQLINRFAFPGIRARGLDVNIVRFPPIACILKECSTAVPRLSERQ